MGEILEIDLVEFGDEFFQDPPAVYQALREHGPALPVVLPNGWQACSIRTRRTTPGSAGW